MRKVVAAAVAAFVAGACAAGPKAGDKRPSVVASFYPLAEAVREVAGDRIAVTNLTPSGAEPHDLELTSDQLDRIRTARVVVYLSHGFQPAVERAVSRAKGIKVDALAGLPLLEGEEGHSDPHVWLDPPLFAIVVDRIGEALARADPGGADRYSAGAAQYRATLSALQADMAAGLAHCQRRVFITGHAAFGYLAKQFGLEQQAIAGLAPEAAPAPKRMAALADLVHRTGSTTIYTETLASPKVADSLARETGATTAVLDPIEGLTSAERTRGDTYVTLMRRNLAALQRGLSCAA